MPDEPTKEVRNRKKVGDKVVAAVTVHSDRVGKPLDELLNAHVREGEERVNWAQAQTLLGRHLDDRGERMVQADLEHSREMGEDKAARRTRDDEVSRVFDACVRLRDGLLGMYPRAVVSELGFDHETPIQPDELLAHVKDGLNKVATRVPWPEPFDEDEPAWTQDGLRKHLQKMATPLEAALTDLAREEQESKGTLTLKWAAIDEHQNAFAQVAAAGAALFRLAGEFDLAERIKPTTGRPASKAEEEEGATEGEAAEEEGVEAPVEG